MLDAEITEMLMNHLKRLDCYLKGHFKLVSGKHSDSYLQVRIAMMDPEARKAFGEAMAGILDSIACTSLAAITTGGILLAKETSEKLRKPLLIGARRLPGKPLTWLNMENIDANCLEKVILIDDVLTTGGTLRYAIQSLKELGATIGGIAVAVDRSISEGSILLDNEQYHVIPLMRLPLNTWDPGNCEICRTNPKYTNLHNPEEDFLSVVLSMPQEKAPTIIEGYKEVYALQKDEGQIDRINRWAPWLPSLLEGLPGARVGEDSALAQFISQFVHIGENNILRKRVLTELVGHLLAISHIRVETRSLGCSILIGDKERLDIIFHTNVPIRPPLGIKSGNFDEMIPYYDALLETEAVFLYDRDGELFGIRRLSRQTESGETRGIQALREITGETNALGLVVRRERKALSVYREGRLEGIAELSEKTGTWEFSTPMPIVDDIQNIIPGIGRILETVLEISREMVTRGYGALFIVGDVPTTLQRTSPKIKVYNQPIRFLGTGIAAEIAKLDGAVIISKNGELLEASVIIINTGSDIPAHPIAGGSRTETAYLTSKQCPNTVVICVSQNGTIQIFVNGKSWPVSEAITGVYR